MVTTKQFKVASIAALAIGAALLAGTNAFGADPQPQPPATAGLCSANEALVAAPDHTWSCISWPLTAPVPTTSAAPAPSSAAPTTAPVPPTSAAPPTSAPTIPTQSAPPSLQTVKAYLTGYSWYDNDPAGSAIIAYPSPGRTEAGGVGTFSNPITVAVHKGVFAAGTKFYVPKLRKYIVVEDQCAGCTQLPAGATAWLDVWVDGRTAGQTASDQCMSKITGVATVVKNPPADLKVESTNPVSSPGSCPTYSDVIVYA